MVETLERLSRRTGIDGPEHMAEAISLVLWNPHTGTIDAECPDPASPLRFELFSQQVSTVYTARYKGLPPHAA